MEGESCPCGLRAQQPTTRFLAIQNLCPGQQLPRGEPGLGWCTPLQASPSPLNLFCLLCAACPVAPSALTPDPDCNSSSLLTTVFTQWLSQAQSRGLVPRPSCLGTPRESCKVLGTPRS